MTFKWNFNGVIVTLEEVVHEQASPLTDYAKKIIKDPYDAEIIATEAFTALWEHHDVVESKEHIEFYLFATVRNRCLKYLKAGYFHSTDYQTLSNNPEILNTIEVEERNAIIRRAVRHLPAKQKHLMELYLDHFSKEDIARDLNSSAGNVRVLFSRAVKRLKKLLKHRINDLFVLLLIAWLLLQLLLYVK